jgi:hypothetical protein
MPSIQDVADQINARLDQIQTNTANTAQNTADVRNELIQTNNRLNQVNNTLTNGFANLSQGLFALLQVQIAALGLLDINRQQNDTIICELANSNDLLCNIMRKFGRQIRLSEETLKFVEETAGILERVHCCEAIDYHRHKELVEKMEECCPPERIPEEPCPQRCPVPVFRDRQPTGQDWKPLPTPSRQPEG